MAALPDTVYYPDSDGKPLGESDWHIIALTYLFSALRRYFDRAADVYVAMDMFLYYEEGNPSAVVAPDIMVIRGVDKRMRPSFFTWRDRQVPCCVIEATSKNSRLEDLGTKRAVYAMLGVPEYFVFDPRREYLSPPLVRFTLTESGDYVREDGDSFHSEQLGLRLGMEDYLLRAYDPTTGAPLLTLEESEDAREAEQRAREVEKQAREAAEEELRQLRAEIARLKGQDSPR
jgi:Uma2 family endonuclease